MAAPMEIEVGGLSCETEKSELGEETQQHSTNAKSIIEKAKSCQRSDPYAAKSLLLMAKTLYPSEFCVQFEAYLVEKSGQVASESSHSLIHLFLKFCEEERLREELFLVTSSLQSEEDGEHKFYRELFEKIPEQYQRQILLYCANICSDKLSKCKLQLLLMKRFPDFIQEYGVALLDSLIELDKSASSVTPCNKFRQLLVTEVLPIILVNQKLEFTSKQLSRFLNLTIEFYITVAVQAKNPKAPIDSLLKSPSSTKSGGTTPEAAPPLTSEFEGRGISDISNPWERLHKLLVIVAKKCGWKVECLTPITMAFQESFTSVSNTLQSSSPKDTATSKSAFYSIILLFFRSMYSYFSLLNPSVFGGHVTSSGVTQTHNFLMEDLESKKKSRRHKHKKKKIEDGKEVVVDGDGADDPSYLAPPILTEDGKELTEEVMNAFTTAVNCWQLVASRETFKQDFTWLLHRWKSDQWPWIRLFQIDMHIYRGEHSQALQLIQEEKARISESQHSQEKLKIQLNLQQASCHFVCGQHTVATEAVLGVLPLFEHLPGSGPASKGLNDSRSDELPKSSTRLLRVVPCKMEALLPYCIQLVYLAFKKRVFPFADAGDTALGHMITLMQYTWPREETIFAEIIKRLTKAGSFSYPVFFTYIINLDFLEEFAYLVTPDAGSIKLDLFLPCITIQRQQRTITRGITRGGKEDFRVNIEKQVLRCGEDINKLIYKFLVTEKDSLLQCLNAHNSAV